MGGRVERGGVVPEERLGAVAVVNVDVHHGHALGAVFRLHVFVGFQDNKARIGGGVGERGNLSWEHASNYSLDVGGDVSRIYSQGFQDKKVGIGRGGGGRTHLLLALVIRPLATHPFRDGALEGGDGRGDNLG